jgi:hypothetical protein
MQSFSPDRFIFFLPGIIANVFRDDGIQITILKENHRDPPGMKTDISSLPVSLPSGL